MAQVTPNPLTAATVARLDRLISEVKQSRDSGADLLLEHLQSARVYLLGAMPDEYRFSLMETRQFAHGAGNSSLQRAIAEEVGLLLEEFPDTIHASRMAAAPGARDSAGDHEKSELYRFFHGHATVLGVFYPTHYIFASLPSFESARNAASILQSAGCSEAIAATGAQTRRLMREIQSDVGVWGALMASISRFFGTEEVFADIDDAKAQEGAAFLAVYCDREEQADRIRDLVMPFEPLAMQLYLRGGIRSLVAGKSPGPQGNHSQQN